MPKPRVPTALLEAKGSFLQHPSRAKDRTHEPVSDKPLGDAPERLNALTKAVWAEIAGQLPQGIARAAHRTMFEVLVRLVVTLRAGKIRPTELTTLISVCGRFGLSPSDRSKIVSDAAPSNALSKFISSYKPGKPS